MIRVRASALLLAGTLTLATSASTARAQTGTAVSLFNEGLNLAKQGRYEEACDRFTRSDAIEHKVGTLLNVGDCSEHLKKFASAWVAYTRAEELALRLKDPRAQDAHDAAARVEPHLSRVVIAVDAPPPGLSVTRNDIKVEPAEYNASIPVDPGTQTISATATGRQPWQTKLRLREGEKQTVHVPALEPAPNAIAETPPTTVPQPQPQPPPDESSAVTRRNVAIGLEIGGGVVLVSGLLFGALAIGKWASITSACPNASCPTEAIRAQRQSDVGTASTFGAISTIGIVAGGAALVTGLVLNLTAPSKSVSVAPSFDRTGAGLLATLRL